MNNKHSNGFHRNGTVTAILSFVCVAAIFAGIGLFNRGGNNEKENKIQPPPQEKTQSSMDEQEVDFERVDANKNAPTQDPYALEEKENLQNPPSENPQQSNPSAPEQTQSNSQAPKEVEKEPKKEEPEEKSASLDQDLTLHWPLEGDIVMDYSIDQAIFDVTLDQYRTNDSVCIQAAEGTDVKASASGTVESVEFDSEAGNTVVINHMNGWKTTYSQLKDDVAVKAGDSVEVGEVIGQVAVPTKYSVLLGDHLEFKVTRDDESIDPKIALAK